ncbi:hypothetical protein BO82DRAFT_406511 [Aspergillus uvarum CBS 121591]|uniref:Uncharacterized protein n=1 Tax=Aspergillus uvarum CBS 121591 TaxID=1448315 RepID=A0A319BXT8_9EURO|nr:hypothetical protein BO82DRAFT_406511 [Aspergillus uvarum CBS 121591]PYH77041.1 hypothetical protein BO82DRAFT_406511 [Aspergillus uvarum CBS 121591]
MQLLTFLTGTLALAATVVSGYDLDGYHGKECGGALIYSVGDYTETGCFNFDAEAGHRVWSVKATYSTSNYKIYTYPKENCKGDSSNDALTSGECRTYWASSNDQVALYSYKVVKA